MGFWKWLKKAVKDIAKTIKKVIHKIGDAIDQAIQTIGNAIADVLQLLGDHIPGIGLALKYLAGIIRGVFIIIGTVVNSMFDMLGSSLAGAILIIGGLVLGQMDLITNGLGEIADTSFGSAFLILCTILVLIQEIGGQGLKERRLNEYELAQVKKVYKKSLNYYVIRIVPSRYFLTGTVRHAFTLGNTIYINMKNSEIPKKLHTLVHECCHVWQYQNVGLHYAFEAGVWDRMTIKHPYDWVHEKETRNLTDWRQFNKEAQAQFLEDVWSYGEDKASNKAHGKFYDDIDTGTFIIVYNPTDGSLTFPPTPPATVPKSKELHDYTDFARKSVRIVRKGWRDATLY